MKHLEYFSHWYDRILNAFPFCLDEALVHTFGLAWLFKDPEWRFAPRLTSSDHQFYNSQFFVRTNVEAVFAAIVLWEVLPLLPWYLWPVLLVALIYFMAFCGLPFAFFFHMRLSSTRLFQCGFGWKQTGRFAIPFRFQTDASSAIGYHAGLPNNGQASGWNFGPH